MRPPQCAICRKTSRNSNRTFKLVYFTLSEEQKLLREERRRTGIVGHPPEAEWFCDKHLKFARKYQDLERAEALRAIKTELLKPQTWLGKTRAFLARQLKA